LANAAITKSNKIATNREIAPMVPIIMPDIGVMYIVLGVSTV
jgi:hypothetical protein